ncbi:D-alanyl-D-alanine endopeptidase [Duganella phyllosphaerae]|uniref:D-alanyl-D-alanine endopeptidase n=1 Tax=Duganella phyllosphaerae TaxID=762836 RepID=A0A1E7WHD6_9BURK|nr:D-alanyl-D-alanine endopeptidase [Duganella phyllosphaerae]OEZ98012.1 D-alanyl-D-alanine endopeptidase precursor [Duganella phyllosphaerae]
MYKLALSAVISLMFVSAGLTTASVAQAATAQSAASKKAQVKKVKARQTVRLSAPRVEGRVVKRITRVNGRKKVSYQRLITAAPAFATMGDLAGLSATRDPLDLKSNVALVLDQANSEVLFEKNSNIALPIASITKMMTGLVVVEAEQDMDEVLTVTDEDVDRAKFSSSRLRVGAQLTRANMLHIALMSSENRAASALGRNYPGGKPAFVEAMNAKARELGMSDTHYVDSSGLSKMNVASARDLAKLAMAAYEHPMLRQFSTDANAIVEANGRPMQFGTTNRLVANPDWSIGLQKTGFINEAGRCLLMQAVIEGRSVIMVFLDSKGTQSRVADAGRIRKWIEALKPATLNIGGGSAPVYSTGM